MGLLVLCSQCMCTEMFCLPGQKGRVEKRCSKQPSTKGLSKPDNKEKHAVEWTGPKLTAKKREQIFNQTKDNQTRKKTKQKNSKGRSVRSGRQQCLFCFIVKYGIEWWLVLMCNTNGSRKIFSASIQLKHPTWILPLLGLDAAHQVKLITPVGYQTMVKP